MKFSGNFLDNIKNIKDNLQNTVDAALSEAANKAAQIARDHINSKSSTGLKAKTQAYRNDASHHGILSDANYASYVELGNGPPGSRIYPKSASALRFVIDGEVIYAKSVKASSPHPYMKFAENFLDNNLNNIIEQHLQQLFNRE